MIKERLARLATHRVTRNVVFWLAFTALFYPFRSGNIYYYPVLLLVFAITIGIPAYIHNLYVISKYLQRRKFGLYIIILASLLATAGGLAYAGMLPLSGVGILEMFKEMIYCHYLIMSAVAFSLLAFGKFMGDSIQYKLQNEALIQQQTESELQMLKSQINPHFLFNALNTLYGMAMRKENETADTVLKLSNILRHTLYESAHAKISLEQEVGFLQEYVEFMRLRLTNKDAITLSVVNAKSNYKIAPLLLIPFVENAIKHGLGSDPFKAWIKIQLEVEGDTLCFQCSNNFKTKAVQTGNAVSSGIGLKNVKRRLELLYMGRYSLAFDQRHQTYQVRLNIGLV